MIIIDLWVIVLCYLHVTCDHSVVQFGIQLVLDCVQGVSVRTSRGLNVREWLWIEVKWVLYCLVCLNVTFLRVVYRRLSACCYRQDTWWLLCVLTLLVAVLFNEPATAKSYSAGVFCVCIIAVHTPRTRPTVWRRELELCVCVCVCDVGSLYCIFCSVMLLFCVLLHLFDWDLIIKLCIHLIHINWLSSPCHVA